MSFNCFCVCVARSQKAQVENNYSLFKKSACNLACVSKEGYNRGELNTTKCSLQAVIVTVLSGLAKSCRLWGHVCELVCVMCCGMHFRSESGSMQCCVFVSYRQPFEEGAHLSGN